MATRMQQRRGTAAQWISTNSGNGPILNAGEIGFETDTNKFKIGDGTNHWINLDYFIDANSTVNPAFGSSITFEGATANAFETTVAVTDPTADRTITLPDATGTVVLADGSGNVTVSGDLTVSGTTTTINSTTINATTGIVFEGLTANAFETTLAITDPTADRTLTLPDASGTVATQAYVDTAASNATFDASLAAGAGLDWNATTDQFDVDSSVATTSYVDTSISTHSNDTTSIHGIADTANLATKTYADTAVSTHSSDSTDVHGIANTADLATKSYADSAVSTHSSDTTAVHGITDTAELATKTYADGAASSAVSTHSSDSTSVHGIADTADLATKTYADTAGSSAAATAVSTHNSDTTDVHGIADTSALATTTATASAINTAVSDHNLDTTNVHGISDTSILATTTGTQTLTNKTLTTPTINGPTITDTGQTPTIHGIYLPAPHTIIFEGTTANDFETTLTAGEPTADHTVTLPDATGTLQLRVTDVSDTEIGYLNGVTSAIQTQIDAKAPLSAPTFTGTVTSTNDLVVDGNLTVNGTTFNASSTSITIEDNMLQLAHQNAANTVDLGLVVGYNDGAAKHSGLVRDVSEDEWKLFKGVTTEPTTTVNFGQGSLDNLELNNLVAAGVVFTDGTQTKEGVQSRTPIAQKTASYTLAALTERDTLVEMGSSSALTLTIPADSTLNFPVGTSLDILQTSTGQVTIAGAGGVTVNATPGLKLRTTWSSATLFKRAANTWVVFGDLTA
jgi:hypothetical protein